MLGAKCDTCEDGSRNFPNCQGLFNPQDYLIVLGTHKNDYILSDETKVLISTDTVRNTEILDMEDPSFACPNVELFPVKMYNGMGALVNGTPFICGGYYRKNIFYKVYYDTCYTLEEYGKWKEDQVASLNKPKYSAASLTMNDKLVVAGGWDGSNRLKTIELASPNTASMILPYELPVALSSKPCAVSWKSDTFMLVGGRSDQYSYEERTYFIDMGNNTVINGPNLQIGRIYQACQEMIVNGSSFIVVAGGWTENGSTNSTEVLSKSSVEDGWQPGQIKV